MVADGPLVSIVIPVLHDAAELERLLGELLRQLPAEIARSGGCEVIVANGDAGDCGIGPLQARFEAVRWMVAEPKMNR